MVMPGNTASDLIAAVTGVATRTAMIVADESSTACARALAVPHILKCIISNLSPEKIGQVKRVCVHWRTTILGSKQIRLARVLAPTTRFQNPGELDEILDRGFSTVYTSVAKGMRRDENSCICCLPIYPTKKLGLHPVLACTGSTFGQRLNFYVARGEDALGRVCIRLRRLDGFMLERQLGDYATYPRCSAVTLKVFEVVTATVPSPAERHNSVQHCVVYVPTDVKIQDVLDVVRAMVLQGNGCLANVMVGGKLAWLGGSGENVTLLP